jgi:hypothetical protein
MKRLRYTVLPGVGPGEFPEEGTVTDLLFAIPYFIGFSAPFPSHAQLNSLTVSREEIERRIPQEALSGQIPTNVIIAAYQRRIARWRPPRDTSVEEGEAYVRLHRLVAGLHAVLVAVTQFYYPDEPGAPA